MGGLASPWSCLFPSHHRHAIAFHARPWGMPPRACAMLKHGTCLLQQIRCASRRGADIPRWRGSRMRAARHGALFEKIRRARVHARERLAMFSARALTLFSLRSFTLLYIVSPRLRRHSSRYQVCPPIVHRRRHERCLRFDTRMPFTPPSGGIHCYARICRNDIFHLPLRLLHVRWRGHVAQRCCAR